MSSARSSKNWPGSTSPSRPCSIIRKNGSVQRVLDVRNTCIHGHVYFDWDPAVGFAGYEERMRSYVEANQEMGRLHVQTPKPHGVTQE